jgi:hypothetical protein
MPFDGANKSDRVLSLLQDGRALIAKGFCNYPFGISADGQESHGYHTPEESDGWVRVCSAGALNKAVRDGKYNWPERAEAGVLLDDAARRRGDFEGHLHFATNLKTGTQASVLAMWDDAIAVRQGLPPLPAKRSLSLLVQRMFAVFA